VPSSAPFHRPPLHHRLGSLALSGILAASVLAVAAAPTLATGGSEFVSLTNVKRASVGLGPVALSAAVDQIAVERGNQMANADVMAHDLAYVTTRLGQLGVCWTSVGEIIAWEKGYPSYSYQRTIDAWWASTGHHAIMVGTYSVAGGSWSVAKSGAIYSVMVFVKGCTASTTTVAAVDSIAPTLSLRWPAPGATGIGPTRAVTIRFSEAVAGVGPTTFTLRDAASGHLLAASVSYDPSTRTAILRPSGGLGLGRWYTAAVSSSIHDATGNRFRSVAWSFKTAISQPYSPWRAVAFSAGRHVAYRFSSAGAIVASRAYSLARSSTASTSKRSLIPHRSGVWYYVTNGVWAGYWMQASTGVVLR
jgi:hypothetical protein